MNTNVSVKCVLHKKCCKTNSQIFYSLCSAHQKHKNNRSLVNVVHILPRFFTKPTSVYRNIQRVKKSFNNIMFKGDDVDILQAYLLFIFIIQFSNSPGNDYRTGNTYNNDSKRMRKQNERSY